MEQLQDRLARFVELIGPTRGAAFGSPRKRTATEPSAQSNGSIAFTRRLKIDSCGRMTGAAACNRPWDGGHKIKQGD